MEARRHGASDDARVNTLRGHTTPTSDDTAHGRSLKQEGYGCSLQGSCRGAMVDVRSRKGGMGELLTGHEKGERLG